jgi:hypothetical protein
MTNRIYDDDDAVQVISIDTKSNSVEEDDAQAGMLAELEALAELGRPQAPR